MESKRPTVLVVEDDPLSKEQVVSSLNSLQRYNVVAFDNGEAALELAEHEPISAALVDIGLPGIDGIETGRRLKALQDVAVVLITRKTDTDTLSKARTIDPYAILSKPVDIAHVRDIVISIVDTASPRASGILSPGFLLDTLYDAVQVGMCVTDEQRRFVRVNRAYQEVYGYLAEELIGREFTAVLPPEDRETAADMHDRFISGALPELPSEWRVQRRDGDIRNIHVTAGRMIGNDGRTYKVTTVTDITDRIARERQLELVAEQKDMLLKELNHRVKNNLATLASFMELEYSRESLSDESRSTLKNVSRRIQALASVYERLQSEKDHSSINAAELIHDITSGTEDSSGNRAVHVRTSLDGVDATTVDIGVAMGLVVNELFSNSLKHALHEGRELTIDLAVSAEQSETGTVYYIDVSDDGPGFPDDFDPETSDSLGMQIVQAISAQHDGDMEIVNRADAHIRVRLHEHQ